MAATSTKSTWTLRGGKGEKRPGGQCLYIAVAELELGAQRERKAEMCEGMERRGSGEHR